MFKTGVNTEKGEAINFGDILVSPMTHDVVVLRDFDETPIVQVIDHEDYIFPLKTFVTKWSDLKVKGNILTRDKSKLKGVDWYEYTRKS